MAAVLDAGRGAVASHEAAAWLWTIPGYVLGRLDVSVPRSASRPREALAFVHHPLLLPPDHLTEVTGIPTTTAERTLCDVAGVVHPLRAERAVDSALAQRVADLARLWLTYGDLTARGRPGRAAMTAILADRRPGYVAPESELEARFLGVVAAAGLDLPERQVNLGFGDWIGRVDFFFRRARLVVEVDGRLAHSSLLDRTADLFRDEALRAAGLTVLRYGWDDVVLRPHRVVAALRARLQAAA